MPGVGDLIGGRYRLESVIGHGALGKVMRAQHITMGREVAVKLLRPDISGHATIRRRLIQRVHQAQKLSHPNNCRLFDFGQSGGSLYLVMELLHGATLRTVIERGAPYPVGWVLDIGMQMLDALGEAHDSNFIHRNLKPANIYLLPRRRGGQQVKILDYGLASSLDTMPEHDSDGEVVADADEREAEICGTAAYLAPETLVQQRSGKATDVYAVGLILIEMLTGKQVFAGDSLAQVLYRQIHTSVRLPPKLEWTSLGKVLLKSVSKHPGNRFQDADSFYEAIEQASETTAPYFRLDPRELEDDDEPMSPQTLARMLKEQRGRRGSDGDDSDGDTDADDAEPEPSSMGSPRPPGIPSSNAAFPLTPPPTTLSGDGGASGRLGRANSGRANSGRANSGRANSGRANSGRASSDSGAAPLHAMRASHPLRDFADDRSAGRVSFPRGSQERDKPTEPDKKTGNETLKQGSRESSRETSDEMDGVRSGDAAGGRRLGPWLRSDEGGWTPRLPVMFVALVLSMAGLGLYLILS
jgi:serine/threonine protein kinase